MYVVLLCTKSSCIILFKIKRLYGLCSVVCRWKDPLRRDPKHLTNYKRMSAPQYFDFAPLFRTPRFLCPQIPVRRTGLPLVLLKIFHMNLTGGNLSIQKAANYNTLIESICHESTEILIMHLLSSKSISWKVISPLLTLK